MREDLIAERSAESALRNEGRVLLLGRILCRQGHLRLFFEGFGERAVSLCEQSLSLLEGLSPSVRQQKACAFTKTNLGWFVHKRGDSSRAKSLLEQALAQASEVGDEWIQGYTLWILSTIPRASGNYAEAESHLRRGIEIFGRLGDQWMKAWCLSGLTSVLWAMGEYEEAETLAKEEVRIRRELEDPQGIDLATMSLGDMAVALGRYDEARRHYRDGLALSQEYVSQEYGSPFMRSLYPLGMGTVAAAEGEYAEAARLLEASVDAAHEAGDLKLALEALVRLGHAVSALGDTQRAVECFRQALRESMEASRVPWALGALVGIAHVSAGHWNQVHAVELLALVLHHRATYHEDRVRAQQLLAELESQLSPEAFAAAVARDQARELEEVVAEILESNADTSC